MNYWGALLNSWMDHSNDNDIYKRLWFTLGTNIKLSKPDPRFFLFSY